MHRIVFYRDLSHIGAILRQNIKESLKELSLIYNLRFEYNEVSVPDIDVRINGVKIDDKFIPLNHVLSSYELTDLILDSILRTYGVSIQKSVQAGFSTQLVYP